MKISNIHYSVHGIQRNFFSKHWLLKHGTPSTVSAMCIFSNEFFPYDLQEISELRFFFFFKKKLGTLFLLRDLRLI